MILIWIFAGLIYLLFNLLITIAFASDNDMKHKGIVVLVLMIAGLPIMIVVVFVAIVLGVMEVFKKNE